MDKSNYELNEWQKKIGEDSFEYEERMSDKINLKSIKQRFNYNTFSELLEKKTNFFVSVYLKQYKNRAMQTNIFGKYFRVVSMMKVIF